MKTPTKITQGRPALLVAAVVLAVAACAMPAPDPGDEPHPNDVVEDPYATVVGVVLGKEVDGSATNLVDALVELPDVSMTTRTDGAGEFVFEDVPAPGVLVLQVYAEGYAESVRRLHVRKGRTSPVQTMLKALENVQVVTLPQPGDEPLVLQVGNMQLEVEAGDLALPTGAPATGDVHVEMTFFHPESDTDAFPAGLAGFAATGERFAMTTFGMMRVEVMQEGVPVNVREGATVTWTTTVPESRRALANRSPPESLWLDFERGLWKLEAESSYDSLTGTMTAELPHFSTWNCDDIFCEADSYDGVKANRGMLYDFYDFCPNTDEECEEWIAGRPEDDQLAAEISFSGCTDFAPEECENDRRYYRTSPCGNGSVNGNTTCASPRVVDANGYVLDVVSIVASDGATFDGCCFFLPCVDPAADGTTRPPITFTITVQVLPAEVVGEKVMGEEVIVVSAPESWEPEIRTVTFSYEQVCDFDDGRPIPVCGAGNCPTPEVVVDGVAACGPPGTACRTHEDCCQGDPGDDPRPRWGEPSATHECGDRICVPVVPRYPK